MFLLRAAVTDGIVNRPFLAIERRRTRELIHLQELRPMDEFATGHPFSLAGTAAQCTRSTPEKG
jgi:hypothetical protein